MELDYEYYNPNPRGKIVGDCVKRAIVVASGIDYCDLELFMRRNKVDKSQPFNFKDNYERVIDLLGGKKINMNVPAGRDRWHVNTINSIMCSYPHISYVLRVSKHLIGVKDMTIYDTFDDRLRDKGIYVMWIFNATEEETKEIQERCSEGNRRRFIL